MPLPTSLETPLIDATIAGTSLGFEACMRGQFEIATHQDLFRHVAADNAALYRHVLDVRGS